MKTTKNPTPIMQLIFTMAERPKDALEGPDLVAVGRELAPEKFSDLREGGSVDAIVKYFEDRVLTALPDNCLPRRFLKLDESGAVAYEAFVERVSERKRLVSYYQYEPIKKPAKEPRPKAIKELLLLQVILTIEPGRPHDDRNGSSNPTGSVLVIERKRVPGGPNDPCREVADEPIVRRFEEQVRCAASKDAPFQEIHTYYFDGSIERRVTIARISERERLISYYGCRPSRQVSRKLAKEAQERRASAELQAAKKHVEPSAPLNYRQLIEQCRSLRKPSARSPVSSYEQASRGGE
jgi:hypothetical protein